MTERITEVRRFFNNKNRPWVVDILVGGYLGGYVRPGGTAGNVYEYEDKADAEAAEALYLAKNAGPILGVETSAEKPKPTCGMCIHYDSEAVSKCCLNNKGTTGHTTLVNKCGGFKPYTPTENTVGVKQSNPKYDEGLKKAPLHCIPCGPLYELGLAMFEGSRKYGRHNYRAVGVRASVYYDASIGHIIDWWEGEDIDPESGVHHLIKAMACLLVVRDSMLMGNFNDDRPLKYTNGLVGRSGLKEEIANIVKKYPDCAVPFLETNKEVVT